MITTQVESFTDRLDELKVLLPGHYEELALNQDKVPLSPRYDIYMARERAGELLFVTIRSDGEMIGYFIGFICPGLHYNTCLTCTMDIFYVAPSHRGSSLLGLQLFRAVERELRKMKVQRWFVGSKKAVDVSALFIRLRFEQVETYYSKWIGD